MSEYPSLYEFLKAHVALDNDPITHTRIGDKQLNVYPGKYNVPSDEATRKQFYKLYSKWVFDAKKFEYLTEVQQDNGPTLIDLDFRYDPSVEERQHTEDHVYDLVHLYIRTIRKLFDVSDIDKIHIYVLHKPDVNMLEKVTKDGIHIVIGLSLTHPQQTLLRKHVLLEIDNVLSEIGLTNDYESVLDDGISYGHTNWQMFGSRKPGHDAYRITNIFHAVQSGDNYELQVEDCSTLYKDTPEDKKRLKKLVPMVSAHYTKYPEAETLADYETELATVPVKRKKTGAGNRTRLNRHNFDITSIEQLHEQVQHFLDTRKPEHYEVAEVHAYVMALPVKYADDYNTWIRVGWALHNMDHSKPMFLIWMKFSAKSAKFSFDDIDDNYDKWTNMYAQWIGGGRSIRSETSVDASGNIVQKEEKNQHSGIVTKHTIMYWVKQECPEQYEQIKKDTVDMLVNMSVNGFNEVDIATILHKLYVDKFACVSLNNQPIWYEYRDHRWYELQGGYSLRQKISDHVSTMFMEKSTEIVELMGKHELSEKEEAHYMNQMKRFAEIHIMLKRTSHITNVMKEAAFKFFDNEFYKQLDTNPYLLCCRNGVLDLKNHEFRPGRPEDYLSLCTNIDYIPMSKFTKEQHKSKEEIIEFFEQLFPENDLNQYMWDHLASTLIGTNMNQTFNIYTGSGSNGKSKMVDLMGMVLGDYKGTVPITLVTKKRNNIGSVSPEVIQLKGRRYAVMQEPSKGDVINEGVMKELTGGDPIQGRALFKDVVTFIPQFKLAVCTNTLFDIRSNDDGTWRRIRVCDFMSKFTENPYEKFSEEEYKYQFPIDKKIDEKFFVWKEVLLSMLVERLKHTNGNVEDCEHVLSASNRYREGQDVFADFVKQNIERSETDFLKTTEVYNEFKLWYMNNYSNKQVPKKKDLDEYLNKKLGKSKAKGWDGWRFKYEEEGEEQ